MSATTEIRFYCDNPDCEQWMTIPVPLHFIEYREATRGGSVLHQSLNISVEELRELLKKHGWRMVNDGSITCTFCLQDES